MAEFNGLLKGTDYIARVVPVNVVGNGTGTIFIQNQTAIDRKLSINKISYLEIMRYG